MTDILAIPCTVAEVWHRPELGCCTPLVPCDRPGTVERIDAPIRDAVEIAGRSHDPKLMQAAAWLVEARAEVAS